MWCPPVVGHAHNVVPGAAPHPFNVARGGCASWVDTWTAGAAEHADLLHCLPGNVLLAPCALGRAARSPAGLPQPSPAAGGETGAGTTRAGCDSAAEALDREEVIRRLAVSRRSLKALAFSAQVERSPERTSATACQSSRTRSTRSGDPATTASRNSPANALR